MDLIDRQDAIEHCKKRLYESALNNVGVTADDIFSEIADNRIEIWLNELPSAEPLVRCKDCKHWYMDADTGMACEFTNMSQPNDGFCNWAERRTDE